MKHQKVVTIKEMSQTSHERTRQIIQSFEAKALKKRSFAVKAADNLTTFFGSIAFLFLNIIVFVLWVLVNVGLIPFIPIFDPYPFVFLITAVSLEAIILTTVVLMSQNRQAVISSLREEIDMQVNLIAEREISKALELLKKIIKERNKNFTDEELDEMIKEIDTSYIERRLAGQLSADPPSLVKTVTKPLKKVGEKVEETLTDRA